MSINFRKILRNNIVIIILIIVTITMWIVNDRFMTAANIVNIFSQICIYGVVAYAMTIAIICGEFDLSVGSTFALSSIAFIYLSQQFGVLLAFLFVVAIGAFIGFINGIIVSKAGIHAFIVTLGSMVSLKGLALFITDGKPIRNNDEILYQIGNGDFFGIPYLVIIFIAALIIFHFILTKTRFGRNIFATGGNCTVAKVAGINVVFYKTIIFVILGAVSALQGALLACRLGSGSSLFGGDLALSVVAMVVIGGTKLTGGKGSMIKTFFGVLVIGVIFNSLMLLKITPNIQDIIRGVVLIAVVSFDALTSQTKRKVVK